MIQKMVVAMMAIIPIIIIVAIAIVMIPCWFILKKAGFSPWLSMLCLIPSLGTLVLLYVLAFADWKVVPVQHGCLSAAVSSATAALSAPGVRHAHLISRERMLAS